MVCSVSTFPYVPSVRVCKDDTFPYVPSVRVCKDDTLPYVPSVRVCKDDTLPYVPSVNVFTEDNSPPLTLISFSNTVKVVNVFSWVVNVFFPTNILFALRLAPADCWASEIAVICC